jgi:hypothetical protein
MPDMRSQRTRSAGRRTWALDGEALPVGFRMQLIAISGKEPDAIQREYDVATAGRFQALPESPVVGAVLPGGAYLLFINDEIVPNDGIFARLSKDASLAACYANETHMISYASAWVDGSQRWSVYHDAERGLGHLESTGTMPEEFRSIRDRLFAEQAGSTEVDFVFDIPIELFVCAGGIWYNRDIPGAGPEPWAVLSRLK